MSGGRKPGRCGSSRGQGPHFHPKRVEELVGAADSASASRWSVGVKPRGLAGKRMNGASSGNRGSAAESEKSPEEQSPGAWEAETCFRGSKDLRRQEGSQTLKAGPSGGTEKPPGRLAQSQAHKGVLGSGYAEGPWIDARSFAVEAGSA